MSDEAEKGLRPDPEENPQQPRGSRKKPFWIHWVVYSATMFCASSDTTGKDSLMSIMSDEFGSSSCKEGVSWYGVVYTLVSCAVILGYGRLYSIFSAKAVFAVSLAIMVLGSTIRGHAPSPAGWIVGQVAASLGNAGILAGFNMILIQPTPVAERQRRPFYGGMIEGTDCIALGIAPLVAGAVSEYLSRRVWMYIVGVPVGIMCIITMVLFRTMPETARRVQDWMSANYLWWIDGPLMGAFVSLVVCLVVVAGRSSGSGSADVSWPAKQSIIAQWIGTRSRQLETIS